jgi:predicted RNA methylase
LIGKNYLGQDVHATSSGSRYIKGRDGQPMSEETASVAPAFLRIAHDGDIDLCADGFVRRLETENMRSDDIRKFCAVIYGEEKAVEPTDSRLRDTQEAIEAAIFRKVERLLYETGDIKAGFVAAAALTEHQPPMIYRTSTSIDLQQYSTPATLSIAAQYALGDVRGLSVLEPTIGNASLISTMSGARITGVEMDKARFLRTSRAIDSSDAIDASSANLIHGDFLDTEFDEKFDAIIGNPPFGGLDKTVLMSGLRVTRLDHQVIMKALESRVDNGRAVFIIGADRENMFPGKEGIISGGSERLFAWLADHYEIRAFEVSGNMYKKQGAAYPVRIVAVGGKRSDDAAVAAKLSEEYRIKTMPVVFTLDQLWDQASSVREFMAQWANESIIESVSVSDSDVDDEIENPSFGNDFQSQYQPMSPGNTIAMIPKNMVVPQQSAFAKFLRDHDDPVEFVKKELKLDNLDGFEPEQVDAIALGIWNMKRGRALILADQTGMGKGRIVAAIARWAAINEKQCNFLTEKASLFSDLWRDLRDIRSDDIFTPFIMNADEKIVSLDGDDQAVLVQKTSAAVRQRLIDSGAPSIDDGYNMMLSTYSQFNKSEIKSAKAGYIKNASKDGVIIMDESHNAAGDSNTGRNITEAVMMSASALYSSATFAKNAKNMGVYYKAFPESIDMNSLTETLIAGGEPLQEVLSAMLCEDGVLVRREHDLSQLKFSTLDIPKEMLARNVAASDQISDILAAMSYFSGDVERVATQLNDDIKTKLAGMTAEQRQGNRMGVSYTNFGSRLYSIARQVSLILSVDLVVENAIKALQNGQKPVIVLEQTMESIMNEMMDSMTEEEKAELSSTGAGSEPLTVKDLLSRLLTKMMVIVRTESYGNVERVSVLDISDDPEEREVAKETIKAIQAMINKLPEIVAMPIDIIENRLKDSGYACGEVSGRSTTYTILESGNVIGEKNQREKNSEIFKFNSGEYDAIVITRSGCTGVSLHSSERFSDRRQRVLIEAQIAANVNERVQFFGRVNRRGQVSNPEIWSVTSGLPWEKRSLAMQNMKLRKLSANTQSNRNNAAEMKDVPDILNPIGNEVCKSFLMNNPSIMSRLSIDPEKADEGQNEDGCYFANKLTGRLCLLRVSEQESIYRDINAEYQSKIIDLNNKGINPLESRLLDVKATVLQRKVLLPGADSGSVFDSPVYAEKIGWTEDIEPIRSEEAKTKINDSINGILGRAGFAIDERTGYRLPEWLRRRAEFGYPVINPSAFLSLAIAGFNKAMDISIPDRFINRDDHAAGLAAALADTADINPVKRMHNRKTWLENNLVHLMPGCPIKFSSDDGVTEGLILSVSTPSENKEHYLGSWEIKVLPIGAQKTIGMSYNSLIDDTEFEPQPYRYTHVHNLLDAAPSGKIEFSKWTLSGNLFRASEMAAKSSLGRAGIYTDKNGSRHRAVICKAGVDLDSLLTLEVSVSEKDAREEVSSMFAKYTSGKIDFGNDIEMRWRDNGARIRLIAPGTKAKGGHVFLSESIMKFTGVFSGSRTVMSAEFEKPKDMDGFVGALYSANLSIKKRVDASEEDVSASLSSRNRNN